MSESNLEKCSLCKGAGCWHEEDSGQAVLKICNLCAGSGYKSSQVKHLELMQKYNKLLEFVKTLNFFTIEIIHDSYRERYMDRACKTAEEAEKILKEIGEL